MGLPSDYFTQGESKQIASLMGMVKEFESGRNTAYQAPFRQLHEERHFFEHELNQAGSSTKKNNLFVRLLAYLTMPKISHLVFAQLSNFVPKLVQIWDADVCQAGKRTYDHTDCSSYCVLRALANCTCSSEARAPIGEALLEARFFDKLLLAASSALCKSSMDSAMNLMDNLTQNNELAKQVLGGLDQPAWAELLLKLVQKPGQYVKSKRENKFKRVVQSILAGLARADEGGFLFEYAERGILRSMAAEVTPNGKFVHNALIGLHNFALFQAEQVYLLLCSNTTEESSGAMATRMDTVLGFILYASSADVPSASAAAAAAGEEELKKKVANLRILSTMLVCLFAAKGVLGDKHRAQLVALEEGIVCTDFEFGMWCLVYLVVTEQEKKVKVVRQGVLERLAEYLELSNQEEDFPVEFILLAVRKVLLQGKHFVQQLEGFDITRHLYDALEIAYGNEHAQAFAQALGALEAAFLWKKKKAVLLEEFCAKFVDDEDEQAVLAFNALLAKGRLGEFSLQVGGAIKVVARQRSGGDLEAKARNVKRVHQDSGGEAEETTSVIFESSQESQHSLGSSTRQQVPVFDMEEGEEEIIEVQNAGLVPPAVTAPILSDEASELVRIRILSEGTDARVFTEELLSLDILRRMADMDTQNFVAELCSLGISSLSAKRLLAHCKPDLFGPSVKEFTRERLVDLLLAGNKIKPADICHFVAHDLSLNVLLQMNDEDFNQAGIKPLLKARLIDWMCKRGWET